MLLNEWYEESAQSAPDKATVILADSDERITLKELNDRSNQLANYFRSIGLSPGDCIAILMENNIQYPEIVRAALRAGLYYTSVNHYLKPEEAAYIVEDCGAKLVITSSGKIETSEALVPLTPNVGHRLVVGEASEHHESYIESLAAHPATPTSSTHNGDQMLYSSGTTGRPKGIRRALTTGDMVPHVLQVARWAGYDADTRYLATAPLYHSAQMGPIGALTSVGGTAVIMSRFDAQWALQLIEQYEITHGQFVPTMFIRMLKLPDETRRQYAQPKLKSVVTTAASCPVEVKKRMIEWWGPILSEFYGGTESNGLTSITSEESLTHPGSVGRAILGVLHICDDDGRELPAGEAGLIYFERDHLPFFYHNDPEKTRRTQHPEHPYWTTLGDIGYVDEENYLYLTDRKSFMIISGGVNIYPQAVEDCLCLHPKVEDVAVIGVPHEEMGEEVKAIVETAPEIEPSEELAQELIDFTRERLAHYTCPRSVDFVGSLPRLPTGKLYKKQLRDAYWAKPGQ